MAVAVAAGDDPSARMLQSWQRNATTWTDAVRERRIASRRAGTDAAVIAAVIAAGPTQVLDVGCGEGWLARALSGRGGCVVGIDASEALIASARMLGGGTFGTMTYAEVGEHAAELGAPFDVAVCNFSLLEENLAPVLDTLRAVLHPRGRLIIQTVHPWTANGSERYADGWRVEEFADFGADFAEPMPWYFRTLTSWIDAVGLAGFRLARIDEPIDAASGRALSLIIEAQPEIGPEQC